MLAALALASSLWVAAQEAGARAIVNDDPVTAPILQVRDPVPVEKIADDAARDLYWIIGSHAGDLYATAWAIERCSGACGEANPFGPTPEARIALKMAGTASTMLTVWKLRRDGHGKTATFIRWATVAFNGVLIVNNSVHAIRGK